MSTSLETSLIAALLMCSTQALFAQGEPVAAGVPQVEQVAVKQSPQAAKKPDDKDKDVEKDKKRNSRVPEISGFAQFTFKQRFDANGDGTTEPSLFRMQRVRVRVEGYVLPWVSYQVEIDPRAPEVGGVLRDAYIDVHVIPHHRLRLGQQKTQFGYENLESSSRLYTVTRSELSENPARGVTLRDIGVGVVGRVPLGGGWRFEDGVTVVNGSGMNVQVDDTKRKNFWGRAGMRYREKDGPFELRFGASGATGDEFVPADPLDPLTFDYVFSFNRFGVDCEVDSKWLFAAAEFLKSSEKSTNPAHPTDQQGWYVLLAGKTKREIGPVLRYDVLDTAAFKRWTIGGYWRNPDDPFRVMMTYEKFEDDAGKHDDRLFLWSQVRF